MEKKSHTFISKMMKDLFFILFFSLLFFKCIYAQNEAFIDLTSTHQIIRGFGAANILPWRPDMTAEEINTAFGTGDGQIGFSILRLRVPSNQSEFQLNVPTAQSAHSLGVTLIASPWSPPAAMKTNNDIVRGELKESYYDDFAAHLKSFADYLSDNGAPLYGISVQNEPDVDVMYESCDWNASQMVKFIKENGADVGTKLMAPESFQFRKQLSDPILNDDAACANLDIVAGHIYGGGLEPYPLAESKGKELWMTEHLQLGTSWSDALSTANDINNCMRVGMSAYIWWYIVRFYGPIGDGEIEVYAKGEVTKRGYAMSQFARFIRPGYYRIACDPSSESGISITAYKDTASNQIVIVAVNTTSQVKSQTFTLQNGHVELFTPYVTSETKDCSREEDIPMSNGSFSTSLEGSSITTFVSSDETGAVGNSTPIPNSFELFQNYPNPFNPSTEIRYILSLRSHVDLTVCNMQGQTIRHIENEIKSPGTYAITWDGCNDAGRKVSTGAYLVVLKTQDRTQVRKALLVR